MAKPPDTLETDRLLLRLPIIHDADAIFEAYAQDEEVTKFLIWRPHQKIDTTRKFIHRCIRSWKEETAFPWVIVRKKDERLIGMIELRIEGFRADLGYVIAREFWGQGYATEVTKFVIEWALTQEHIYRVWATCDIENLASARVLEKASMQLEGILRRHIIHPNISDEPRNSFCYSIVK